MKKVPTKNAKRKLTKSKIILKDAHGFAREFNRYRTTAFQDGGVWKTHHVNDKGEFIIKTIGRGKEAFAKVKEIVRGNFHFDSSRDIIAEKRGGENSERIKRIISHNKDLESVNKLIKKFPSEKSIKTTKKEINDARREKLALKRTAIIETWDKSESELRKKLKMLTLKKTKLTKKEEKALKDKKFQRIVDNAFSAARRVDKVKELSNAVKKVSKKAAEGKSQIGERQIPIKSLKWKYTYSTHPHLWLGKRFSDFIEGIARQALKWKVFRADFKTEYGDFSANYELIDYDFLKDKEKIIEVILDKLAFQCLLAFGKEIKSGNNATLELWRML